MGFNSAFKGLSYEITYSVEKASLNRLGSALKSRGIGIQFPTGQKDICVFQIAQIISEADEFPIQIALKGSYPGGKMTP